MNDPLVDSPSVPLRRLDVQRLRRGLAVSEVPAEWRLSAFAGRFGEVSGGLSSSSLTLVFRLVLEAQRQSEPVVWITRRHSSFFPPDVADAGIDLAALPVVWAPETLAATRAADHLLRSGSFGLLVLDVGEQDRMPMHAQTRLAGLARQHDAALLCITRKESHRPSVGSLVSLRAQTARTRAEESRYCCEAQMLKDKRRGPGWKHEEVYRGPDGLR